MAEWGAAHFFFNRKYQSTWHVETGVLVHESSFSVRL